MGVVGFSPLPFVWRTGCMACALSIGWTSTTDLLDWGILLQRHFMPSIPASSHIITCLDDNGLLRSTVHMEESAGENFDDPLFLSSHAGWFSREGVSERIILRAVYLPSKSIILYPLLHCRSSRKSIHPYPLCVKCSFLLKFDSTTTTKCRQRNCRPTRERTKSSPSSLALE